MKSSSNSWVRENFILKTDGPNPSFPAVPAWIHLDRAKESVPRRWTGLRNAQKSALSKEFKPVSLGVKATFRVQNRLREIASNKRSGKKSKVRIRS